MCWYSIGIKQGKLIKTRSRIKPLDSSRCGVTHTDRSIHTFIRVKGLTPEREEVKEKIRIGWSIDKEKWKNYIPLRSQIRKRLALNSK